MKKNYNHLIILSEKDAENIMNAKDFTTYGFCSIIKDNNKNNKYNSIREYICKYKIRYDKNKTTIFLDDDHINVLFGDDESDLIDFAIGYHTEEQTKYVMKIDEKNSSHYIVLTTTSYFEKSKAFVSSS